MFKFQVVDAVQFGDDKREDTDGDLVKTLYRTAALGAAVALLASACGGGGGLNVEADPRQAVLDAFENMGEWSGASMTLRLDSTVSSLVALAEGDPTFTPEVARAVLDSRLEVKATQGESVEDTSDDEMSLLLRVGDIDGFELRTVDGELYLRAAVRELVERYDESGAAAAELDQMASQVRSFGLEIIDTAIEGGWIQITGLQELQSMMEGMMDMPEPDPEEARAIAGEMADLLTRFLEQDVTATYVGSEDAGEHVRLTASGEALLDVLDELLSVMGSVIPSGGGLGAPDPGDAIDQLRAEAGDDAAEFTVPLEVWIDGDTVGRVGFDMRALAEENQELMEEQDEEIPEDFERLLVVIDLAEFGGGIAAPDDATEFNLFDLVKQFMESFGGGFAPPPQAAA